MPNTPDPFLVVAPLAPPGPARRVDPLAFAAVASVLLDMLLPLPRASDAWSFHWLDAVAIGAFAVQWFSRRGDRSLAAWTTPYDLALAGALALAVLRVIPSHTPPNAELWLHQGASCLLLYYVAAHRARRTETARSGLWPAFGVMAAALGAHAAWASTTGPHGLAAQSAFVDRMWGSEQGLAKALAFASVVSLGRTFSRTASPWWRLASLLGFGGLGLHAVAGGLGLDARALGRLNDPLYFSTLAVMILVLLSLAREAWRNGAACDDQRPSWFALAIALAGTTFLGVFGEISGGAGLRVLVAVAAGITVGGYEVRRRGDAMEAPNVEETLRDAA